jgi:predicted ArsR family transcriptional regulator
MPAMLDTRRVILETLSQHGALPIDEIARAAHRATMATRYHLGLLIREGLVVANAAARNAGVGRPQTLYALADRAHAHLPKQYDALAAQLLEEIIQALGEKETRARLRRAGRRLADAAPPLRRGARLETRLNRTASFLSARGYLARWEKSDGEFALRICNCPYRQVALAHRQVCEMDRALLGGLAGLPLKMTHCIAHQDSQCVFSVKPPSALRKITR